MGPKLNVRIFSATYFLTSLRRCRLGVLNVDKFIMILIMKNWPSDARSGCLLPNQTLQEFLDVEDELFDDYKEELEKACYLEDDLHK